MGWRESIWFVVRAIDAGSEAPYTKATYRTLGGCGEVLAVGEEGSDDQI